MFTYAIQSYGYDTSGNLVVFVDYLKDGVRVIQNRPHSVGHLDNLKIQVQTILNQLATADSIKAGLGGVATLPDLTPTPISPDELAKQAIAKLYFDVTKAKQDFSLGLITQSDFDAVVALYKATVK